MAREFTKVGVVGLGTMQVLLGLSVVAGSAPLDRAIVDRSAWGSGWVLDGARASYQDHCFLNPIDRSHRAI